MLIEFVIKELNITWCVGTEVKNLFSWLCLNFRTKYLNPLLVSLRNIFLKTCRLCLLGCIVFTGTDFSLAFVPALVFWPFRNIPLFGRRYLRALVNSFWSWCTLGYISLSNALDLSTTIPWLILRRWSRIILQLVFPFAYHLLGLSDINLFTSLMISALIVVATIWLELSPFIVLTDLWSCNMSSFRLLYTLLLQWLPLGLSDSRELMFPLFCLPNLSFSGLCLRFSFFLRDGGSHLSLNFCLNLLRSIDSSLYLRNNS